MTKLQTCYPSSASSKLGIGRDSHVISKFKPPKIRIIHIYAPEIIKTDGADFRELVQILTGKPEDEGRDRSKSKIVKPINDKKAAIVALEINEQEFMNLQNRSRAKNEEEVEEDDDNIWRRSSNPNEKLSGCLDGFSDQDGFMEELSTVPLLYQH